MCGIFSQDAELDKDAGAVERSSLWGLWQRGGPTPHLSAVTRGENSLGGLLEAAGKIWNISNKENAIELFLCCT